MYLEKRINYGHVTWRECGHIHGS